MSLLLSLLFVQLVLLELLFGELLLLCFLLSLWFCLGLLCFFFLLGDCPAHRPDAVRRVGDDRIEEFSLSEGESRTIDSDDIGNAELILLKIEVNFGSEQLKLLFFAVIWRLFIDSPN